MKTRSNEKTYPDVGGGFVEPHPRGDGIDWSEKYPYKGTETIEARGLVGADAELERGELGGSSGPGWGSSGARAERAPIEIHITPPVVLESIEIHITPPGVIERQARPLHTCAMHGLWLCELCTTREGGGLA